MRLFSPRTFKHVLLLKICSEVIVDMFPPPTCSPRFHYLKSSAATEHLISPLGELLLRRDVDLVLHAPDLDDVSQIACLSVDLNPLFEEGFLLNRLQ